MRYLLLSTVALIFSCSHFSHHDESWNSERVPNGEAALGKTLYLSKITSSEQFNQIAQESTGVIRQGETIKVFIDNRDHTKPVVYYMNANYCPQSRCSEPPSEATSHYSFAKKVLQGLQGLSEGQYMQNAYYTTSVKERNFFDARIQKFKITKDGVEKTYYGVRFIERDLINNQMIQHAITAILKTLQIPEQNVAFILNSEAQQITAIQGWLDSNQIAYFTMEKILSGINYIGLNPGIAYGFLRVDPVHEEDLEPYDIPLFSSLPLDLAVVAGTITTEYQDVGSHVNLKAKERGTPNMVLRDPVETQALKALDGKPIKLTVEYGKFKYEVVTDKLVFDEYNKKINKPWKLVNQVNETKLVHFDEMCASVSPGECLKKSSAYGGKVAGLGFLAHSKVAGTGSELSKVFGYKLNPMGFGVPLSFYNEFMKLNLAKNPELKKQYDLLVNSELGLNGLQPLSPAERRKVVEELKKQILQSEIPEELYKKIYGELQTLKEKVDKVYGSDLNKLKIRSSSNAEDIEGFNGAGLHDSYSAKIKSSKPEDFSFKDCKFVIGLDDDTGLNEEDIEPKSVACAIKASYASLWNVRAVKERSFKRFDHRSASMGLSIQTSYKFRKDFEIKSNSVLVTRVIGTESVYGQQVSTQVGNGLVTNPLPNTKSELVVVSFDGSAQNFGINVLQYAKPKAEEPARTSMILTRDEYLKLSKIARDVEIQYCEAKTLAVYYPGGSSCRSVVNSAKKPLSLDMEFKQYTNGQFLIKQVRTFSGK